MPRALTPQEKEERALNKIQEELTGVPTAPKKDFQIRKATERPQRATRGVFNGTRGKLAIDPQLVKAFNEAGWHLHIFNDSDGRVSEALEGGYEFVMRDEVGDGLANRVIPANTDPGEKVRFRVGTDQDGDGQFAYLMKIPTIEWEENQKLIQERNNRTDQAIRAGKNVKQGTASDGFYNAGISLKNN
jgi:hypothetical protein